MIQTDNNNKPRLNDLDYLSIKVRLKGNASQTVVPILVIRYSGVRLKPDRTK